MVCTDASPVQPVLKTWLLRDLHRLWNTVRPMHRCLSWHHRFIRCFTCCFTWCLEAHRLVPPNRASDLPTTVGCTDARGIGSSGATSFSTTRSIQRFFEFFLRVLLCMIFFTLFLGSRNVHLTKPLVPLIALSYDHQNPSKWHKWCHVRYKNIFTGTNL